MPSEMHFQEFTIATKIEKVFLCAIDETQPSKKLLSKRTRCFLKMELNTILFHGLARNLCYATTNGHRVHFRSFYSTTCLSLSFLSCPSLSRLTHVSYVYRTWDGKLPEYSLSLHTPVHYSINRGGGGGGGGAGVSRWASIWSPQTILDYPDHLTPIYEKFRFSFGVGWWWGDSVGNNLDFLLTFSPSRSNLCIIVSNKFGS